MSTANSRHTDTGHLPIILPPLTFSRKMKSNFSH